MLGSVMACSQASMLIGLESAEKGSVSLAFKLACAGEAALQGASASVLARDVVPMVRPHPLEAPLHLIRA